MKVRPKVTLRHVVESDLPLLCRLEASSVGHGDFAPTRMTSPHSLLKRFEKDGFSSEEGERFMVCDETGAVVGSVSHFPAHFYSSAKEIGWEIHDPARRGQGYGTAAARALVDYLFENYPINRICCATDVRNAASRRTAENAGMQLEGQLRGLFFLDGEYIDNAVYGILRADWQSARDAARRRPTE
jgi:RimJ/RimL family protein N-acetyltransferase